MMTEDPIHISVRIVRLPHGGFVLGDAVVTEEQRSDMHANRACSSLDELKGAIATYLDDWDRQMKRLLQAEFEDANPNVVQPKKWWRAVK